MPPDFYKISLAHKPVTDSIGLRDAKRARIPLPALAVVRPNDFIFLINFC